MKKHILLIEDDSAIAEVVSIILTQEGLDVTVDATGSFVLKHRKNYPHVDLALVDYLLPHMTGDTLIKIMRANSTFSQTKIVLMSANSIHELQKMGKSLNADAVVAKPFDVDDLVSLIKKLIN